MNCKKYLLLLGILFTQFAAMAADSFTLGSCDHKIASSGGYGSDNAGEISAALYVPASRLRTLAGNSISRVDVGLISRINVRDMTVWVRKDLNGDNLASETIERGKLGWNEVSFANPYVIEQDSPGLYIGFTYANSGSSHPVSFIGDAGEYTTWFRAKSGDAWQDMTARGALSLEAIVTGSNLPQYDVALLSGYVAPDPINGDDCYTVHGEVSNMALKAISGFNIEVGTGGERGPEQRVNLSLAPGAKSSFTVSYQAGMKLSGDVEMRIVSVADGQDADMTNNAITTRVAFPRNVLFEEFTTEQCPNCPSAAEEIETVMARHDNYNGRVVSVAHHAAFGTDYFTRDCDTELIWMFDMDGKSFAPAGMFDRQPIFRLGLNMDRYEPIVAIRSGEDVEQCIEQAMAMPTHAMVALKVIARDETAATVEVRVLTDDEFALANPHLTFYAIEDNMRAISQQGASGTYYHQHVIREDNGAWGEPVEIEDNLYTKTFTVELKPEYNLDNLGFVAFIAERDENNVNNNVVENSAYVPLIATASGVTTAVSYDNVTPVATYDIYGRPADMSHKGIVITVFSDGSTKKSINL